MEWQPIETADKDSRARLVWVPEVKCIFEVYWEQYGTPGCKPGWAIFGGGWRDVLQHATHWMPLPEPPK